MILALDGGLGSCGYAVVRPRTAVVVELGTLTSKPAHGVDEHTDRMRRAGKLAETLRRIATTYAVTVIAVETPSLGAPPKARLAMAIALYAFVGVVLGLAVSLNVDVVGVTPKQWQHAVTGLPGKVDYEQVFADLHAYVDKQSPQMATMLSAIPMGKRNHALDATGVGLFAAIVEHTQSMRVMEATR